MASEECPREAQKSKTEYNMMESRARASLSKGAAPEDPEAIIIDYCYKLYLSLKVKSWTLVPELVFPQLRKYEQGA